MALNQCGVFSGTMMKSPLVTRWDVPPVFEEGVPDSELFSKARAQHLQTLRPEIGAG